MNTCIKKLGQLNVVNHHFGHFDEVGHLLLDPKSLERLLKQQSTIRSFFYSITGRRTLSKYILFYCT